MSYSKKLNGPIRVRPCKRCKEEDELNEDGYCRDCFFEMANNII